MECRRRERREPADRMCMAKASGGFRSTRALRRTATVPPVTPDEFPAALLNLSEAVVPAIRQAYDINANRFDPLVGDDTSTFGFNVYRNSWYLIEQALKSQAGWLTARPDGSLRMAGSGYLVHSYRHGSHENVDLNAFRLDDPAHSLTKQQIAQVNGQLVLDLEESGVSVDAAALDELPHLVVIHAGNHDDGCCGVWIGAPLPSERVVNDIWAWIEPLWLIDRPETSAEMPLDLPNVTPHDELPEPEVDVRPLDDRDETEGQAGTTES